MITAEEAKELQEECEMENYREQREADDLQEECEMENSRDIKREMMRKTIEILEDTD